MTFPLHLTLTGRPLLLHAPIVPELQSQLASAYSDRAARLADRAHRRAARRPSIFASVLDRVTPLPQPGAMSGQSEASAEPAAPDHALGSPAASSASTRLRLSDGPVQPTAEPYLAQITIRGPLLNRAEYWEGTLCIDGYDRIEAEMQRAMHDPACLGIFLDMDSPGGLVSGCFELSDRIRAWREEKPILAFTDGLACSAAYAIACAGTEVHGTLSAMIGSVGVIYGRQDASRKGEAEGDVVHFFTSGDRKAFGQPDLALGDQEREETQAQIDALAEMFFDRVAAARPLTVDAVRDLQAGYWLTDTAMTHGLVDARSTRAEALARLMILATAADDPIAPSLEPQPTSEPKAEPEPTANLTLSTTAAPTGSASRSTPQEKTMSIKTQRARASLTVLLSAAAASIAMAAHPELDPDRLALTARAESERDVEAMDDDEVEAMNDDDDTQAMEEEDTVDAASDDDMAADDEDDTPPSARVLATRIARRASAALLNPAASAPKPSRSADPKRTAKAGIDPDVAAAIQALPEAQGRAKQAAALSITPGMTEANAKRILKASAKEGPSRLASVPNPSIGGSAASLSQGLKPADQAQRAAAKALRDKAHQA